jgi:NodT family efflux transporter outer membrane factor (OMF) lipoprotein
VGPDFHAPAPPTVAGYTASPLPARTAAAPTPAGAAQRFVAGLDVSGRWWTSFGSPALDALVDRALAANPDLQAAQAALRVAREAYYAQRGALLPTLDAGYGLTRQKVSQVVAPPLASNVDLYTLHTAQLNVGYVPDLFGGVRRQVESAQAQAESQRFQTEAAYLTLTSNLVAAAIQEASLRDQIAATRGAIEAQSRALQALRDQFARGEIARGDVAAQASALAQLEQSLPPLEKQRAQQADLIAILTGRPPAEVAEDGLRLSDLRLPTTLPVSLPAALVAQRPDVRAAQAALHAASAQIGVAAAARLPNIVLSANAGGASTAVGRLFSPGDVTWALAGSVTQPIFQGGALLHRQRGAQAAYAQAEAQYRSTVLTSFQNVADSLQALQSDASALAAAARAEREAADSLAIAQDAFRHGQVNSIAVFNAEQARQQARLGRVQAEGARLADTAALFEALGGGWWNRSDTPLQRP